MEITEIEALKYFREEVQHHDVEAEEEVETRELNEEEQAHDFLQRAGLNDLSKLYQQGEEITENVINQSVRLRNLTDKQIETVRYRVRTLNSSLHINGSKRNQRLDIRNIAWNVEISSTGTRSRSCTPDSLDSSGRLNDELTSDEDQQLSSLPPFPVSTSDVKTRVKVTISDPHSMKFSRSDRADVAHLGSQNVVLKGYHQLSENGTLPRSSRRERSGSNPTTEIFLSLQEDDLRAQEKNLKKSHISASSSSSEDHGAISFEGYVKQSQRHTSLVLTVQGNTISIDNVQDYEYQFLKSLLYVELMAIFDQYPVKFLKRRANYKKGGNVFGANLSTLVMRDMPLPSDNTMVPKIFQMIVDELNSRCTKEDGILRLGCQKRCLDILCSEIEEKFFSDQATVQQAIKQASPHELASVLKRLLRELPDPIFTLELFEMFYKTNAIPNEEDKMKALNLLVLLLPVEHRNTCRLIFSFLHNIIENEEYTRMDVHNVALIMAPSFFPPRLLVKTTKSQLKLSKAEVALQINGAAVCCLVMKTLLKAGDSLWNVPVDLVNQAREAQRTAVARKEQSHSNNRARKTKLVRSSTQYVPGAMNHPRMKRDLI